MQQNRIVLASRLVKSIEPGRHTGGLLHGGMFEYLLENSDLDIEQLFRLYPEAGIELNEKRKIAWELRNKERNKKRPYIGITGRAMRGVDRKLGIEHEKASKSSVGTRAQIESQMDIELIQISHFAFNLLRAEGLTVIDDGALARGEVDPRIREILEAGWDTIKSNILTI